MADGPRSVYPATVGLIGLILPVAVTLAVLGLRLDYPPSLVVAAIAFGAGGIYAGRQARRGLLPILIPLLVPTLAIYSLFALNAQQWQLLGVPVVAVVASLVGVLLARRPRRS